MPHQPSENQLDIASLASRNSPSHHQSQTNLDSKTTKAIRETLENSKIQTECKIRHLLEKLLLTSKTVASSVSRALDRVRTPIAKHEFFVLTNPNFFMVPYDYQGPRIEGYITREVFLDLIEAFQRGQILHEHYVLRILHEARSVLRSFLNYNYISSATLNHVFIVGDLHGQLSDLLHIFKENGLPSYDNPYLFNGNFVGYGPNAIEVFLLLMVALILNPTSFFLNRGNHEDALLNIYDGLQAELISKYKTRARSLLVLLKDVFSWLPLYSILDTAVGSVMVVHAGISNRVHISQLINLDKIQYPTLAVPPPSKKLATPLSEKELDEYHQVRDLFWSNPLDGSSCPEQLAKEEGQYFSQELIAEFLKKHNMSMMIRSHQVSEKGVETHHDGQVMTVFSASNYRGGSNFGGILRWELNSPEPSIITYKSTPMDTNRQCIHDKEKQYEDIIFDSLIRRILSYKTPLERAFQKADEGETNHLPRESWAQIMTDVTQLDLPWLMIRSRLVKEDSQGILYNSTFEDYELENTKAQGAPDILERLYRWKDSLLMLFRVVDRKFEGYISREELADIVNLLYSYDSENYDEDITYAYKMCSTMDLNRDGRIDVHDFFEGYRLICLNEKHDQIQVESSDV